MDYPAYFKNFARGAAPGKTSQAVALQTEIALWRASLRGVLRVRWWQIERVSLFLSSEVAAICVAALAARLRIQNSAKWEKIRRGRLAIFPRGGKIRPYSLVHSGQSGWGDALTAPTG